MAVWAIFLEYPFPGKVGSDLGEEKPITSIRWTTQFVRARRISDLYNLTQSKIFMANASQINRSQNSVRVERMGQQSVYNMSMIFDMDTNCVVKDNFSFVIIIIILKRTIMVFYYYLLL